MRRAAVTGCGATLAGFADGEIAFTAALAGAPLADGALIEGLDATPVLRDPKSGKVMDRRGHAAVLAAVAAAAQAHFTRGLYPAERVGTYLGATGRVLLEPGELQAAFAAAGVDAPEALPARAWELASHLPRLFAIPVNACMASSHVALQLDARGPSSTCLGEAAAGVEAIGRAAAWIARGQADAALAGGADSPADALVARAQRCRDPQGAPLREGAALLVLEELQAARARGATVLAEVVGFGSAGGEGLDAGEPAARSLSLALRAAGASAGDVSCLFASGPIEGEALARHLGVERRAVRTSASVGDLLAAAGAFDAACAVRWLAAGQRGGLCAVTSASLEGAAVSLLFARVTRLW